MRIIELKKQISLKIKHYRLQFGAVTNNDVNIDEIQKGEYERVTVNLSHQCGAGGD